LGNVVVAGVIILAALQLVRPEIPVKPATAELQVPPEVRRIFDKSCYSCHSANAARDNVFLQFYSLLAAAAPRSN